MNALLSFPPDALLTALPLLTHSSLEDGTLTSLLLDRLLHHPQLDAISRGLTWLGCLANGLRSPRESRATRGSPAPPPAARSPPPRTDSAVLFNAARQPLDLVMSLSRFVASEPRGASYAQCVEFLRGSTACLAAPFVYQAGVVEYLELVDAAVAQSGFFRRFLVGSLAR